VADGEPLSGVAAGAEDVALEEAGGLVWVVPFELSEEDDVTLGADLLADVAGAEAETEALAEAVAVDPAEVAGPAAAALEVAGFAVAVVHLGFGAGPVVFVAGAAELALLLALGLALAVLLVLGLALAVALGLGLGLAVAVSLGLAVPVLPLPLDDTAGEVAVLLCAGVALPDEPAVAGVCDGCGEAVGQVVARALGLKPAMFPDDSPVPVIAGAELGPLVDPALPADEEPVMAELSVDPIWVTSARVCGTEASTTPRVNTASPAAKAGRSIAPRQSRFGAGRSGCGRWPRKPSTAGQTALTPWCWLARAERERIFWRICSRPSAPGST
jgi:hypothetical protein